MSDKNVVTVEGNLTKASVLIEREGRTPVCLLRLACNRSRLNPKTGEWENHPRFFDVKVYGAKATEVSTYAKGEKVRINEGYLDWYEKGKGAERREFMSIIAADTPDGITRVVKDDGQAQAGEQSQASEEPQVPEQAQADEQSQASEEAQAPEQAQAGTGSDDAPASPAKAASKPANSRKASGGTSSAKSKSTKSKASSTKSKTNS
jgi:single stranded DNA-binding protein